MVVTPDNRTLIVAESIAGKLTAFDIAADGSLSNRRTWADGIGADGICLDAEGAVWAQSGPMSNACVRVREGGEVLERIELDRSPFACMLGGPDGRTLFILAAEWRGFEKIDAGDRRSDRPGADRRCARAPRRLAIGPRNFSGAGHAPSTMGSAPINAGGTRLDPPRLKIAPRVVRLAQSADPP